MILPRQKDCPEGESSDFKQLYKIASKKGYLTHHDLQGSPSSELYKSTEDEDFKANIVKLEALLITVYPKEPDQETLENDSKINPDEIQEALYKLVETGYASLNPQDKNLQTLNQLAYYLGHSLDINVSRLLIKELQELVSDGSNRLFFKVFYAVNFFITQQNITERFKAIVDKILPDQDYNYWLSEQVK